MNEQQFKKFNKDLILREKLALQRTVLANQTTFLAFLRTALYFVVAGLTIHQVLEVKGGHLYEILFLSMATLILIAGIINFFLQRTHISKSQVHIGNYKMEYLGEAVIDGSLSKPKKSKKCQTGFTRVVESQTTQKS